MRHFIQALCFAALLTSQSACASASPQQLTPEQLEAVRRGAATSRVPAPGTTVPLLGPPELPLVEVRLNGTGPYRFLVDLGSNIVIIRRSVADEAGLEVVLDRERSDIVRAATLALGDASFEDVWIGAYDELDVDGVIGYNLLMGTGVVMDYGTRTLRLGPIHLPDPDGLETLPYEVHSRLPYVAARIGERTILLNFDTGATNHIVFPASFADSLSLEGPPEPGPALYNNQTGVTRVHVARLNGDLRFGGHVIKRPVVFFDEDVEDAWLGSAILVNSRLELDTERRVMRLTSTSPLASPAYRTFGFGLGAFDAASGTRPVTDLIPGTPAAAGAIEVGDRVLSLGGVPAEGLDAYARRALAAESDSAELVFVRGGRTLRLPLGVAILP